MYLPCMVVPLITETMRSWEISLSISQELRRSHLISGPWTWIPPSMRSLTSQTEWILRRNISFSSLNFFADLARLIISDKCHRTQFCSYPAQVCVYYVESSEPLPDVTVGFEDEARTAPPSTTSCSSNSVRLHGQTQTSPGQGAIGMIFDAHVQAVTPSSITTDCNAANEMVIRVNSSKSLLLLIGTGTNYDQKKGNSDSDYSFKGADPYPDILSTVQTASKESYESLRESHITDHQSLMHQFTLNLPDPKSSAKVDTTTLINGYSTSEGDPFVEGLIIDYARYLFIASSRPGSLPPNLQGNWAATLTPPWSGDYHINVNLQMYRTHPT